MDTRVRGSLGPPQFVDAPILLSRNPLDARALELRQQLLCLHPQRLERRILRLPLAVDLLHHEHRVALDHHTPLAVLARQPQAEYQRVPLSGVVGPLVERRDGLVEGAGTQLDGAGSRYRAGTLPPPSKWMVANFIT